MTYSNVHKLIVFFDNKFENKILLNDFNDYIIYKILEFNIYLLQKMINKGVINLFLSLI